jgi:hypothetical protein
VRCGGCGRWHRRGLSGVAGREMVTACEMDAGRDGRLDLAMGGCLDCRANGKKTIWDDAHGRDHVAGTQLTVPGARGDVSCTLNSSTP